MERGLELLLLCDHHSGIAATVRDHILALETLSKHTVRRVSMLGNIPKNLDLARFDGIIIHYSLVVCSDAYLSPDSRRRLRQYPGLKVVFIQDEYRHVDRTVAALAELNVDLLFTCVPESEMDRVYARERLPAVHKVSTLTGFVPRQLCELRVPRFRHRPVDVGYRSREVPAWLGELGQDKWRIGPRFLEDSPAYGLKCDISSREEDRLYGESWTRFLTRCKAVLGTESGASVFDFSGEVQAQVESHLCRESEVSFGQLKSLYFSHLEGKIRLNQISPRCFEAAALRTLMILYEGEYSGILIPERHYLPLNKDHSNMSEVVRRLRDADHCEAVIEAAFAEVAENPLYSFEHFVGKFDAEIRERWLLKVSSRAIPYEEHAFERAARADIRTRRRRMQRYLIDNTFRILFGRVLKSVSEGRRRRIKRTVRRHLEKLARVRRRLAAVLPASKRAQRRSA